MNNSNERKIMSEEAIKEKYLRPNKTKLQMAKLASAMMIIAALLLSRYIFKKPIDISTAVYDEADKLSETTVSKINERNAAMAGLTDGKAKIVVVTEKEKSGHDDLKKKAEKLFKKYKLGNDGMLVIVSVYSGEEGFFSGIGNKIGDFFGNLFGGGAEDQQTYAYCKGKNMDYVKADDIKRILDAHFSNIGADSFECNEAFLGAYSYLADLVDEHYGIKSQSYGPDAVEHEESGASNDRIKIFVGVLGVFVALFILLSILTGKKSPLRVYKKPFWFGLIG